MQLTFDELCLLIHDAYVRGLDDSRLLDELAQHVVQERLTLDQLRSRALAHSALLLLRAR